MLIDSNILVYALNTTSPKHQASRLFLHSRITEAVIAHQNILEVTRVLTHPMFQSKISIKAAARAMEQVAKSMKVIYPNEDTIWIYRELLTKYSLEGNRVFDVYLAATALSNGITEIATDNDKHFRVFEEIKVINPF